MKKALIAAAILLVVFVFSAITLVPSKTLPPGRSLPPEAAEILETDRAEKAVAFSNFRYRWHFFATITGLLLIVLLLATGVVGSIRRWANGAAEAISKAGPVVSGISAFVISALLMFASSSPKSPVSGPGLGIALGFGLVAVGAAIWRNFGVSVVFVTAFTIVLSALTLPLAYYRGFAIEHFYGQSNQSLVEWFSDFLRGEMVVLLTNLLLVPAAFWVLRKRARDWWVFIAAAIPLLLIVSLLIVPIYVDPLFNRFKSLPDDSLRTRILELAEEAGIEGGRVFEVDKSSQTKALNAYVTGLFGTKRIVLWDTLLEKMDEDEIAFVMAHEMAHYVENHIWWLVVIGTVTGALILFVVSRTGPRLARRFGVAEISDIASYPVLVLIFGLVFFLAEPATSAVSRILESRADIFALELTKDPEAAVGAFVALANENLADPAPGRLVEFWLLTHPTLADRIERARSFESDIRGDR